MRVSIRGRNPYMSTKEIVYAIRWALKQELGKRLASNIGLKVVLENLYDRPIEDRCKGEVGWCDRNHMPREFEMGLHDRMKRTMTLKTIFHEVRHIFQFATNQMKEMNLTDDLALVRWKKRVMMDERVKYETCPWETDAVKAEGRLLKAYREHLKEEQINF
jgi:hypothetical protein